MSPQVLLAQSAEARFLEPLALELNGLRLIEASAGTGKTYTIAMLYVRLVLGHVLHQPERLGQGLLPPDILVLTFTDAAAGELRERIRLRLQEAATAFRQHQSTDDLLMALLQDYAPEQYVEAAFVLDQAAQWLDEAAISTIHAWCLRVLQQHAFDTGSLFAQTLVKDLSLLRADAVRDVWRHWFYPLPAAQAGIVQKLLGSPDAVSAQLASVLATPDALLCQNGVHADQSWSHVLAGLVSAEADLQTLRMAVWQQWALACDSILALLNQALVDKQISASTYKATWLNALSADMQGWLSGGDEPAKLDKLASDTLAEKTNKNGTAPKHPWFDAVQAYQDALPAQSQRFDTLRLALLSDIRHEVQRALAEQMLRRGELGFDDLLKRVDAALHGEHGERLAARLRERYPVALIDEFQDTDPLQFRLFKRIYSGHDNTSLLMIGDPKQAIYSFRGADLPTYLQARTLAQKPYDTLSTNFRSDMALVAAVNGLFSYSARWPRGAFADVSAGTDADTEPQAQAGLGFYAVTAQQRYARLRQRQADASWQPMPAFQLALPESALVVSSASALTLLAEHCAAQIADWLQQSARGELAFVDVDRVTSASQTRALGAGDIAILVRKGKEAKAMRVALQALGIASVYGSDRESVFASSEAAQLQIWLEALAEPSDERRLRLALATPALGRDWAALNALREDEQAWEREVEQLRKLALLWRRQGVLAALREWLFCHEVPARLLHAEWANGERELTNFLHLAELLQTAAVTLHGEHALVRYLAQCRELHASQGDEALVRLESDSERIRVVTLHQAKGLEYAVVCMPFTAMPAALHAKALRRYHTAEGDIVLDLDIQKGSRASELAAAEQLAEDMRLFYVGVTRARHLLWLALLPVAQGNNKDVIMPASPWAYILSGYGHLVVAQWHALWADFLTENSAITGVALKRAGAFRQRSTAPIAWLSARHFRGIWGKSWRISSYSALARRDVDNQHLSDFNALVSSANDDAKLANYVELMQAEQVHVRSGLAALPRGAEIGSFWHLLLEEAAALGFSSAPAVLEQLDQIIRQRCQQRGWQDQCEPLQQALRRWLCYPLSLPEQPILALTPTNQTLPVLRLTDLTSYQVELEFWLSTKDLDVAAIDALVSAQTLAARPRQAMLAVELNGLFKGFMDLVFEHNGRYFIADYKSNYLGDFHSDYHPEALSADVAKHRYDLQYVLYVLAMHRLLRSRLSDYDYDRHIGGAVYIYLRGWDDDGHGIHCERPTRTLIDALDALFQGLPAGVVR